MQAKANYRQQNVLRWLEEEIEAQVTQLKKWAEANGIVKRFVGYFRQKDSEGNWTGNYIHRVRSKVLLKKVRKYERFEI